VVSRVPSWVDHILTTEGEVICLLDSNLRIVECNRGWDKFASENGGIGVSGEEVREKSILDFTPQVLRRFYEFKYAEAWRLRGQWIGFDYDCSSAEKYRLFHMALHACNDSRLLVVNSQLRERVSPLPAHDRSTKDTSFRMADGRVTMCAHCRRSKRQDNPKTWDWVARFVAQPGPNVAHDLCAQCREYFYPPHFAAVKEAG